MNQPNPLVIIPAFNEEATISAIVRQITQRWNCPVVVVDDCSTDATAVLAQTAGATVLPLTLQLGAWGAIQTGIRYALRQGYKIVVTLDADGQHDPNQIGKLLEPVASNHADVTIGAFPERASRARRIAWHYFRWLTGLKLEDITSGFRAYNHAAMNVLVQPEASLLDYQDVGVLLILRHHRLRISEIPVWMKQRIQGSSHIFRSWWIVSQYMLQTSVLCLARIGQTHLPRSIHN
jgi:glycosyltransferase involved in cell wall biosynthesis